MVPLLLAIRYTVNFANILGASRIAQVRVVSRHLQFMPIFGHVDFLVFHEGTFITAVEPTIATFLDEVRFFGELDTVGEA